MLESCILQGLLTAHAGTVVVAVVAAIFSIMGGRE